HIDENVVAGGAPTTFTVTVSNNSQNDVAGAHIANTVFGGNSYTVDGDFRFFSDWDTTVQFTATGTAGTSGYSASGTGDIDDVVNIPAHGQITYTVSAGVASAGVGYGFGQVGDVASVTAPNGFNDMIPYDNSAHDVVPIVRHEDVSVTITDSVGGSS